MDGKCLIFLGPPGTGKGTQAARMKVARGLVPLSSGDALRHEIKCDSPVGRQAEAYVAQGKLVPDEVITGVMLSAIETHLQDSEAGIILDGFPRTVPQAEALEAGLAPGRQVSAVLDFVLDDAEIVARIVSRRVCSNCGRTYNVRFFPPKRDGICDVCGGEVEQRVDDREDVIRTRLETYRSETAPLVAYYRSRGLLHEIAAGESAAAVEAEVRRVIESLG